MSKPRIAGAALGSWRGSSENPQGRTMRKRGDAETGPPIVLASEKRRDERTDRRSSHLLREDHQPSEIGLFAAGGDRLTSEANAAIPVDAEWRETAAPVGVEVRHEEPPRRRVERHRLGPVVAGEHGLAELGQPTVGRESEDRHAAGLGAS